MPPTSAPGGLDLEQHEHYPDLQFPNFQNSSSVQFVCCKRVRLTEGSDVAGVRVSGDTEVRVKMPGHGDRRI